MRFRILIGLLVALLWVLPARADTASQPSVGSGTVPSGPPSAVTVETSQTPSPTPGAARPGAGTAGATAGEAHWGVWLGTLGAIIVIAAGAVWAVRRQEDQVALAREAGRQAALRRKG